MPGCRANPLVFNVSVDHWHYVMTIHRLTRSVAVAAMLLACNESIAAQ